MKKIFTLIILPLLLFWAGNARAQSGPVTGKVLDGADGTVIPGVTVSVKGTTTAASTDVKGIYHLKGVPADGVLVFRFLGYVTQEVQVNNRTSIDVKLATDSKMLQEVTVSTALGIARQSRELGYSAQGVTSQELNENHQPNVVNALQGKVAGVTISSIGGGPGQGANIKIRGVNSISVNSDNQPLFVIDGILMDNSTSTLGAGSGPTSAAGPGYNVRSVSNRASDINPDDIETMNVLKGGAATALYGLRGSNGVIVITTKRGKGNGVQVNYSSTYGFENPDKLPDVQKTYTAGILGVYTPIGLGPAWGPTVQEAIALDPTHPAQLYDNYKQAYNTGKQSRNSLSVAGGNDVARFYSSVSYLDQTGMLPFTDYKNFSGKLNTDIKISPKFKTSVSMTFTNAGGYSYDADRFGESLAYFSPRWDVSDYMNPDGTQVWRGTNNPIYGAATNRLKGDVNRFIGGVSYNYTPTNWLDFSYRAGIDTYTDNRVRTAPGPQGIPGEHLYDNADGYIGEYNIKFRSITSTFIATFHHKIATDLNATVRVGQDIYDRRETDKGILGSKLNVYNYFNLRNASVFTDINDQLTQYHLMGLFGEADFDYKNYLFLSLTLRKDITSSLSKANRNFNYPSASLSYVFSDHLKLPEFISFGKLRASFAQQGKDAQPYAISNGYTPYTSLPTGNTGYSRSSLLGNPDLKPQFTNTYEGGLEMGFFKNRVSFDLTYYYSLSKDQIIQSDVSSTTGYVNTYINAGTMRNKGIELILKGTPVKTNDFSWNTSLNFSANRNKIISLPPGVTQIPYGGSSGGYLNSPVTMQLIAGQAYGNIYGTIWQRYGSGQDNSLTTDKSKPMLIGANGFPVLGAAANQKLLGNSQPKWIGGLSNTFTYKSFSLTALIDGRWGFQRFNRLDNFFGAFGIADYTSNRRDFKVFPGVLADGTPNTKSVWLGQGVGPDGVNYGEGYYRTYYRAISEPFVEDASWIRLRTLTLTYSLPAKFLPKKAIRSVSISATGNNLWLHTNYYGLDPESISADSGSNVDGWSGFTYPAARQILFTLNVGF